MKINKLFSYLITVFLVCVLNIIVLNAEPQRETGELLIQFETEGNEIDFLRQISLAIPEGSWQLKQKLIPSIPIWLIVFDETKVEGERALTAAKTMNGVQFAQWNHIVRHREVIPSDTLFHHQWNLKNAGQAAGLEGADIEATQAWKLSAGGTTVFGDTIVVAILDGGVDINHPDLDIWVNNNEIAGTGLDDDNNGYIDDVNGWNAASQNGFIPANHHGTHVAGIAAAIGNNVTGISGVSWNTKILPVVVQNISNEAQVVAAYGYVYEMRKLYNETNGAEGAFIVSTNASFGIDNGQPENFPIWCSIYDTLGKLGILNAGATANFNADIDLIGDIPTACPSPWLISVTSTNRLDNKVGSAAYGKTTIDIGAPGSAIFSTRPFENYGLSSGTSMATPHVAGAIPLLFSAACDSLMMLYYEKPDSVSLLFKNAILNGVDELPTLRDLTVSNGRLNVYNSVLRVIHEYCNDCVDISIEKFAAQCYDTDDGIAAVTILGNNPEFNVLWEDSTTGVVKSDLPGGKHKVWIQDTTGCQRVFFFEIDAPEKLELNFLSNPSVGGFNNGTATAVVSGGSGSYQYQWNDPNTQTSPTAVNLFSGYYTVTVTDDNQCVKIDSVFVDAETGLNSIKNNNSKWKIFPNPATDKLYLYHPLHNENPIQIKVFDLVGRSIYSKTKLSLSESEPLLINTAHLPDGVYLIAVFSDSGNERFEQILIIHR